MRGKKRYKFIIEDEARLNEIVKFSFTPLELAGIGAGGIIMILLAGYLFVLLTPAKTLIPGYFKASQRAATENAILRVDSLLDAYNRNEAYLANLRELFNSERQPSDTMILSSNINIYSPDSLLPPSQDEKRFVKLMQEREKFNISVKASMAGEGMLFYPPASEGQPTLASRDKNALIIEIPSQAPVMAIADGAVLARYYDKTSGGYSLLIQHDNGFISRISGLGNILAVQSAPIVGGEVVALAPVQGSSSPPQVTLELWHDGVAVIPYDFISSHRIISYN